MGPMTTSYKFGSVCIWSVFFILLGESALGETTCEYIIALCVIHVQCNTMSLEFSGIHFESFFYSTIWIQLTNVDNAITG